MPTGPAARRAETATERMHTWGVHRAGRPLTPAALCAAVRSLRRVSPSSLAAPPSGAPLPAPSSSAGAAAMPVMASACSWKATLASSKSSKAGSLASRRSCSRHTVHSAEDRVADPGIGRPSGPTTMPAQAPRPSGRSSADSASWPKVRRRISWVSSMA